MGVPGYVRMSAAPTGGVDAVHTATIVGSPTGGTFTFTDARAGGLTSAPVVFNATAAQMQTAADGVYGAGNTVVTRTGTSPLFVYTFTYAGALSGIPVTTFTTDATGLTGGITPAITPASLTTGVRGSYRGAQPGTVLLDTQNGFAYYNSGTSSKPVWTAY